VHIFKKLLPCNTFTQYFEFAAAQRLSDEDFSIIHGYALKVQPFHPFHFLLSVKLTGAWKIWPVLKPFYMTAVQTVACVIRGHMIFWITAFTAKNLVEMRQASLDRPSNTLCLSLVYGQPMLTNHGLS